MKILLTGANGYIGVRLLPVLVEEGHEVVAIVRSASRLSLPKHLYGKITIVEGDLLKPESLDVIPHDIDVAYYLVHSMGTQSSGFSELEKECAENFNQAIQRTNAKQIIYLSGLSQGEELSEHMSSRHRVEDILRSSTIPVTILRAGIIIGSGSASFEIIRDLVEKLPVMIAPRWVYSRCQPIAIADVIFYLQSVMGLAETYGQTFEIGGPDKLTYREMLLDFAKIRGLKRFILPVPVLTPYLSSLWLFFITSTNFSIAKALVKSLKSDAVCKEERIKELIPHKCYDYETAIRRAFVKIEQNAVVSSWKDAMIRSKLQPELSEYLEVPKFGCLSETCDLTFSTSKDKVLQRLWSIGGMNGWFYMDWAWTIRGWLDRIFGGVGLRRGRTDPVRIHAGDALDFWRVLVADKEEGHLLLYAEMRVPGEAWLEWKVTGDENGTRIIQTATFRPIGLLGRLYWYGLFPVHKFIFYGMCANIGKEKK